MLQLLGMLRVECFFVPMAGPNICAGFPSLADDLLDEEIDLAKILIPNPAASFLWRVSGQSMRCAGIFDGDVVVVDRSAKPQHGNVVVVSINGETSLKLFQHFKKPMLAFANPDMSELEIDETA